jgi:CheY-like chemotaxis protein
VTIIVIDSPSFSGGPEVARVVSQRLGLDQLEEAEILAAAARRFDASAKKLQRALHGPPGLLDGLRGDRMLHVAYLRVVLASLLQQDGQVHHGSCGHLIPMPVTHVLRVGLVAPQSYSLQQAERAGLTHREAQRTVDREAAAHADWMQLLFEADSWDPERFDLCIPIHEAGVDHAVEQICQQAGNPAVATTPAALAALADFQLAAKVQLACIRAGHDVDVMSRDGDVEVLIHKHTLFLDRLQGQLEQIAQGVEGVAMATARPSPRYREANIYVNLEPELSTRALLVDDEREFVETLSERLLTRNIETEIAYDGEEALARVEDQEPEVMVLDLKMPGVDGLEVLRQVKRKHPRTEVIILTGHGSESEEALAAQLGAFAYLRKPVDTDELARIMQDAYAKVSAARAEDAADD